MGWLSMLRRRPPRPPVPVVLYTREGCGLCERMKVELERASVRETYALTEVDVDVAPGLAERFGARVPVLEIDGELAFEGRLAARGFARALRRAADRREARGT